MRAKLIVLGIVIIALLAGCSDSQSPSAKQNETSKHSIDASTDQPVGQETAEPTEQHDEQQLEQEQQTDEWGNEPTVEETVEIAKKRELPEGFVYVDEILEHAQYDIRYYGVYNFVGEKIDGYLSPLAILSESAVEALREAEKALEPLGYAFLIYDAYRPQKAVEHFKEWAADEQNIKMKEEFYPAVDKANVFKLGYLAQRSGHSRGSTVDLTLINIETGEPLDMGGIHDLLDESSAHDAKGLNEEQAANRLLLKNTMTAVGFEPYRKEWWHYTLKNEPYPKKYFDFDVE